MVDETEGNKINCVVLCKSLHGRHYFKNTALSDWCKMDFSKEMDIAKDSFAEGFAHTMASNEENLVAVFAHHESSCYPK